MIRKSIAVTLLLAALLMAGCAAPAAGTSDGSENAQASASQAPAASGQASAVTPESLGLTDGQYQVAVALNGGSGRAGVESPAQLRVEGGQAFVTIVWSSSNYDYMKVDGNKYERTNTEGNSTFEIPVARFDCAMPVIADTVAMSQPHEIDYTLQFDPATIIPAKEAPAA